ncbi:MAG: hypothetical protein JNM89_12320 [Hyphomicrobiaceae bacterium]|nr:hypothetical protein [Hyphomicrobiaceae bacterium]
MVRGFLRVVTGFVLAALVAGLVQVLFARPPVDLAGLPQAELLGRLESRGILTLAIATHSAIFASLFALLAIMMAEWLGVRSAVYYAVIGLAIGLAGFLAQFASENAAQPTIVNTYALIAYATTGLAAGLAYWFFAGRCAGRRKKADPENTRPPTKSSDKGTENEPTASTAVTRPLHRTTPTTSVPTTHGPGSAKSLEVA